MQPGKHNFTKIQNHPVQCPNSKLNPKLTLATGTRPASLGQFEQMPIPLLPILTKPNAVTLNPQMTSASGAFGLLKPVPRQGVRQTRKFIGRLTLDSERTEALEQNLELQQRQNQKFSSNSDADPDSKNRDDLELQNARIDAPSDEADPKGQSASGEREKSAPQESTKTCQFSKKRVSLMSLFMQMNQVPRQKVKTFRGKVVAHLRELKLGTPGIRNLENFMLKFFCKEKIGEADIESLSMTERLVFMAVLVKKRYHDVDDFDFTPETIQYFKMRSTVKRKEQQYKIILKKCFKALINQFGSRMSARFKTKIIARVDAKEKFYNYYFGALVESSDLTMKDIYLETIFNETKDKRGKNRQSKKKVANLLCESPEFNSLLGDYLNDKCLEEGKRTGVQLKALTEISSKVPLIISNWKKSLHGQSAASAEGRVADFLVDFFANKRIKLPWTTKEVEHAVESVKQLLKIN